MNVRTLPSVTDLADGRVTVSDLRNPEIEDLLGKILLSPIIDYFPKKLKIRLFLLQVRWSIGSELCRQIIKLKPKKLLILENSEFAFTQLMKSLNI